MRGTVQAICAVAIGMGSVWAQDRTIPEIMASVTHDVAAETGVQFGKLPSLDAILRSTDVVVRGVVGEPRTYLSDDQRLVYSEFTINDPEVIDDSKGLLSERYLRSDFAVKFTQVGGTITVHGRNYTLIQSNLPQLTPGSEYLFLLKRDGKTFRAAGVYFGVFRVTEGKIAPMTSSAEFGTELLDLPVPRAVAHILARRQAIR